MSMTEVLLNNAWHKLRHQLPDICIWSAQANKAWPCDVPHEHVSPILPCCILAAAANAGYRLRCALQPHVVDPGMLTTVQQPVFTSCKCPVVGMKIRKAQRLHTVFKTLCYMKRSC